MVFKIDHFKETGLQERVILTLERKKEHLIMFAFMGFMCERKLLGIVTCEDHNGIDLIKIVNRDYLILIKRIRIRKRREILLAERGR